MNRREFLVVATTTLAANGAGARLPLFANHGCRLRARIWRYEGTVPVETATAWIDDPLATARLETGGSSWTCAVGVDSGPDPADNVNVNCRFRLVQGELRNASVSMELVLEPWSVNNYVCLPGAVYRGNRFMSRRLPYPPLLSDPSDIGPHVPTIVTDIPRLNISAGPSGLQQVTRDLATPAAGIYCPNAASAFWLLTNQRTRVGDTGIDIEESDDRRQAIVRLTAPFVRQRVMYKICDLQVPSTDRGADFATGDEVDIKFRLAFFPCQDVHGLFDRFLQIRKELEPAKQKQQLPLSAAWALLEEKYNRDNWMETYGYYAVEVNHKYRRAWTAGWVGGLQVTYPLLFQGSELSRERVFRNFDYVFPRGIAKSGFFYGAGEAGEFRSDGQPWMREQATADIPLNQRRWHLVRKSGDVLYYLIKQFMLLKLQQPGWTPPAAWDAGVRGCADAFVRLWDKCGQFGQFVNIDSGEVVVGGSTSAGIAPAGLALASQYYGNHEYLRVAEAAAAAYCQGELNQGLTTGGPLEAAQCADCESAFGLLESLMVLYEVTGSKEWLREARKMAALCASWCVTYDCEFPPNSTFARLGMQTRGTVFANTQNKCAVPGICTHSGASLFKLYRATGELVYLDLLREIVHAAPQFVSRPDRPISTSSAGWVNERVEMGDFLEPIGEIFDGSGWAEIALMLSCVEVPGLYVQPDTGLVCAFDHVNARVKQRTAERLVVSLENPTQFDARVKVLAENSIETSRVLGQNYLWKCRHIEVPARSTAELVLGNTPAA